MRTRMLNPRQAIMVEVRNDAFIFSVALPTKVSDIGLWGRLSHHLDLHHIHKSWKRATSRRRNQNCCGLILFKLLLEKTWHNFSQFLYLQKVCLVESE